MIKKDHVSGQRRGRSLRWRLVLLDGDGPFNMGLDEAILNSVSRGESPPTLRLYAFRPSAVTIGRFQRVRESVDLDVARRLGVPVVRRITGGGSVYHDEFGEVTYSVAAPVGLFPGSILDSYRVICSGLVKALGVLGLEAQFVPVNDVVVNGKKISGSAQVRRAGALLQHGTLMYATDLDTLASLLRAPREKLESHGVSSIRERVTTVSVEFGRRVSRGEVQEAMLKGFEEALGAEFERGEPTDREMVEAERLARERYGSDEWNLGR